MNVDATLSVEDSSVGVGAVIRADDDFVMAALSKKLGEGAYSWLCSIPCMGLPSEIETVANFGCNKRFRKLILFVYHRVIY